MPRVGSMLRRTAVERSEAFLQHLRSGQRTHATFKGSKPVAAMAAQASAAAPQRQTDRRNPNLDVSFFHIPGVNPDPTIVHDEVKTWEDNVRDSAALYGARDESWWTGARPQDCPGIRVRGVNGNAKAELVSLPALDLRGPSREAMQAYFDNTWTLTEVLFAGLQGEEAFYKPPYHDLRHPMIFYYGHVASLYINKLRVSGVLSAPLDAYYEHIFETGVDEMSWDDLSKNAMLWPAVEDVTAYRREVYKMVSDLIATSPDLCSGGSKAVRKDDPLWALVMGFEHERIHLETSSVLMREMPLSQLQHPKYWPADHPGSGADAGGGGAAAAAAGGRRVENEMVAVQGRDVRLGKPDDFPSFGWDNEYGTREQPVGDFEAAKFLTTNADMVDFVKAGGYQNKKYWSADGWGWKEFRNVKHPTFFVPHGPQGLHQFELRTVFGLRPLDGCADWPAIVNKHEAAAFCAWKSERDGRDGDNAYRVVTEAEHDVMTIPAAQAAEEAAGGADMDALVARDGVMGLCGRGWAEGEGEGRGHGASNINLGFSSESPVDAFPANELGFHDTRGNVWEWCEDHFNPLDGFQPESFYQDFSTPCFDGEHHVIKGGSFIATGDEASRYSRYHFRPHFFQHAGFRLVASAADAAAMPATLGQRDANNIVQFASGADAAAAANDDDASAAGGVAGASGGVDGGSSNIDMTMLVDEIRRVHKEDIQLLHTKHDQLERKLDAVLDRLDQIVEKATGEKN